MSFGTPPSLPLTGRPTRLGGCKRSLDQPFPLRVRSTNPGEGQGQARETTHQGPATSAALWLGSRSIKGVEWAPAASKFAELASDVHETGACRRSVDDIWTELNWKM